MTETTGKDDLGRARDRLHRHLASRDHSRSELRTKLAREFTPEIIETAILEAERNHLLAPESEIAARFALSLRRQNKSHQYIEGQLRKRGLPPPDFELATELESARLVLGRKFGPARDLSFEERTKAYRFLMYRGFDDRSIRQVLNEKP